MSPKVKRIVDPKAITQGLKDLFEELDVNNTNANLNPRAITNSLTSLHGIFNWLENTYDEVELETCSDCG